MKKTFTLLFFLMIIITSCKKEKDSIEIPNFPGKWDLRTEENLTPAKNQENLGSCWAFACIGLTEYIIQKELGIETDLSEQHLVNCAGFGPLDGLNFLKDNGVASEEVLPYESKISKCNSSLEAKYKISGFETIVLDELSFDERITILQEKLMNRQVFITHLDLYCDLDSYKSGIYEYNGSAPSAGGHIILVIGFVNDSSVKNGGYWICKNSWGSSWGENGYFKIPFDECNIAIYYAYTASSASRIN